jgi:uncharacterized membrane protein YcaP (DUF421 family)
MSFFTSQESLTAVQWILRAVVGFVFLLAAAKLMGQRAISQLRFLDFIIALLLGNIIAHPLSDEQLGLEGSLITTFVLILLYISVTWLSLKWHTFNRFLDPLPLTLVKNGEIQMINVAKARISIDFLFSELRKEKAEDIKKVALAIWEPGGTITVFLNTAYQPLTPSDLKLDTAAFSHTQPIIIEGRIDTKLLKQIGKNRTWLLQKTGLSNAGLRSVDLATIDDKNNIHIHYNSSKIVKE